MYLRARFGSEKQLLLHLDVAPMECRTSQGEEFDSEWISRRGLAFQGRTVLYWVRSRRLSMIMPRQTTPIAATSWRTRILLKEYPHLSLIGTTINTRSRIVMQSSQLPA